MYMAGTPGRRPGTPGSPLQRLPKGQLGAVIAVGSGKGGVGKSSVAALLACELARQGKRVGLLDADITGPSIPKLLGLKGPLSDHGEGIEPAHSPGGISVVSSQFLVEESSTPVIWRGPLVTRLIMQFFGGVNWGALDFLLLDMPPGTSDVPLTVFQTVPLDGMVFVSTPQELSGLIVRKAMNMARDLHIPLLGIIENMASVVCPKCGEVLRPFGPERGSALAEEFDTRLLGELPIDPRISELGDAGRLEEYTGEALTQVGEALLRSLQEIRGRQLTMVPPGGSPPDG